MITEDYVSFEVAKLLKEKGFKFPCRAYYTTNGRLIETEILHNWNNPAPTLQMAMKWLREEHNIFIEISISIDLNDNYHFNYAILDKKCEYVRRGYADPDWISWKYEEAVEAALKYALKNLI